MNQCGYMRSSGKHYEQSMGLLVCDLSAQKDDTDHEANSTFERVLNMQATEALELLH